MAPKKADKLTDAEKKKIKQANKAKANPKQAAAKAEKNQERRFKRGQDIRPDLPLGGEANKQDETNKHDKSKKQDKTKKED